jgi:hypothetical protein
MLSKNTALIAGVILIVFAAILWDFASTEKILYQENFNRDRNTGSNALTHTDGTLSLDTGSPEYTGSGKWNETIAVQPVKIFCQWW